MEEGLSPEHSGELFSDSLEHFLDGGGVADEGGRHLESVGRDITDRRLDVVGDPFHEVRGVLVLNVEHLFVDFLGRDSASKHGTGGEVSTVSWVGGTHHILGVEHLLGEFCDAEVSVLLRASGCEGGEPDHEEVESGEGDEVSG